MLNFLGASAIVGTILDFLGVAGIIVFGSFIVVLVVDLILAATSEREGLFFNKNKNKTVSEDNSDVVVFANQPAPAPVSDSQPVAEPVEENGIVFYNTPYQETQVSTVDFDKAAKEQQSLQSKLDEEETVIEDDYYEEEEEQEEDIENIALEVARRAVIELENEAKVKEQKVYKVKEVEQVEETKEEVVEEAPIIIEENSNSNDETIKRLEEQRLELERQVALLHAEREKDKEEILKTLQELRDREPVIVEAQDNKEEEEKRRLANITRMNSRLSRIKSSTKKIETKKAEEKAPKLTKVVTVETTTEEAVRPAPVVEEVKEVVKTVEVVEEVHTKPRFKREYYENRLEVLKQELKEVEAEFKQNKKDFTPLEKVYKTFNRDDAKLRRQEAIVAKQQMNINGVNKKSKVSDAKKAKLEENVKLLKQLKESVYSCKQVIEQNKDRYPILEKNNKLLSKQIKRLTEDIESVNEALKWYEENAD